MSRPATRWRVAPAPTLLKFAGALLLAAVAALSGAERERLFLAGVAALALGAYGLRDLLAPVRLSADAEGVTVVSGYAGHRRIPWPEVERVGVGEHRSLGLRSPVLEIDAGESLHLFSRYDLGAPCEEVAETLAGIRRSAEEEHAEAEGEQEQPDGEREHPLDAPPAEEGPGRVDRLRHHREPHQHTAHDDEREQE
jgi:Bacterial PH domain